MKALIYYKKQKTIIVPENWEELTQRQFIKIADLLHSGIEDDAIMYDKALFILCGKSLFNYLRIPLDMRERAQEHIQWVFSQEHLITKNLIPNFKGLFGPESNFDNLQLAEFHHSETAYHRFIFEKDEEQLNELVAILYREGKKNYDRQRNHDGDVRIEFSYNDITFHKHKVKRWPVAVKRAVLLWYDGCRQQLVKDYPEAFNSGEAAVVHDENYFEGLYGIIRSISGVKHGTFDRVERMTVPNAFLEIITSIKEERETAKYYEQVSNFNL
jgi:hypothetical protein